MQDSTLCPRQYLHAPLLCRGALWRVSRQPGKHPPYTQVLGCDSEGGRVTRMMAPDATTGKNISCTEVFLGCVYVCVFFPFILDIKFFGRTGRGHTGGRSHRISHPPSFCGACFNFSREKGSAVPFPRRPWSRILFTNELIALHLLGIFFSFFFLWGKIPVRWISWVLL